MDFGVQLLCYEVHCMGTRMALIFLNGFSQTLMNSPGRNTQNNWTFKSVTSVRRGKEVAGPGYAAARGAGTGE